MIKNNLDNYGGWKEKKFKSNGFFRLDKDNKRHWLVTPEGNAFLSHGVNHVELKWMQKYYNIPYWHKKLNIEENFANEYLAGFIQKVKEDMKKMAWNTLGCHSPQSFYKESFVPYVQQLRFVELHHYEWHTDDDYVDVFEKSFQDFCENKAKEIATPLKNDPYLLGYSMTDCPIFTDIDAAAHDHNIYGWKRDRLPTWPEVIRKKGSESPGKKVYIDTLEEIYNSDINALNKVYKTHFKSFNELLNTKNWRGFTDIDNKEEVRDNYQFLLKLIDKSYEVEVAALKKYDPNHLIFGDKLNGNTDTPEEIIALAGKHFDVIFFQYYALWPELKIWMDKCCKATDTPLFHGDASCSVPNENMPDTFGPHCANQMDRVEKFKELYYNAFARPEFVGWNWCGWMDAWECGGGCQVGKQHSGIQDPFGNFYPIAEALGEFGIKIYTIV